jgi:hypothetical protein
MTTPPIGLPSPNTTPCGTGTGIQAVTNTINEAVATLNNAAQAISSLPGRIEAAVNSAINSAQRELIGPIQSRANEVIIEVNRLLEFVNDPARYLAQYLRIQTLFPNLDLRSLIDRLLRGVGICAAVGQAGGGSTQSPPSNTPAITVGLGQIVRVELPPLPREPQNTSAPSQAGPPPS